MTGQTSPTPIVLCADDFALAPGVSRAICNLVEAGRLSATSCMTMSPFFAEHADWLRPHADRIDVGLHLTLTDQQPLGALPELAPDGRFPALGELMKRSYSGRLPRAEVEAELTRQVDRFVEVWGRPPDFLDGHQHIHQLPVIRQVVLGLARRWLADGGYVRNCVDTLPRLLGRREAVVKTMVICELGRALKRSLRRTGIPTNEGFGGVYDLADGAGYEDKFRRFLTGAGPNFLVMCHPGFVDDELASRDTMTTSREHEYQFFSGDTFPALLADMNVRIGRMAAAGRA